MSANARDPETLEPGDVLETFRGDRVTFVRWEGHKLVVNDNGNERTFYAGACNVRDPRLDETSRP